MARHNPHRYGWLPNGFTRRKLLKHGGLLGLLSALIGGGAAAAGRLSIAAGPSRIGDALGSFFQQQYRKMSRAEVAEALARIERKALRRHGVSIKVGNEPPPAGVVFGYALNISKCKGIRACVEACVRENNQSRDTQIQYIRVLEMDRGHVDLSHSEHYYDHETVPAPGKFYMPIQCMQCDNPPCVKACPIEATWTEPDGITVVDYDWCIGCRYCMAACPYWARRFNWNAPSIRPAEINRDTHYLGNRPREIGVVEKCTFCIQRTRKGHNPACLEACPTGARIFGDLMDPQSDIRYVLENKTVFRLKEELGAEPKFWYFSD